MEARLAVKITLPNRAGNATLTVPVAATTADPETAVPSATIGVPTINAGLRSLGNRGIKMTMAPAPMNSPSPRRLR